MAQVIRKTFSNATVTQVIEWLSETLQDLHDFEDVQTVDGELRLYYATQSYISLKQGESTSYLEFKIVTPECTHVISSSSYVSSSAFQIVGTVNDEILVRFNTSSTLATYDFYAFSLIKCKNGITGSETWAAHIPSTRSGESSQNFYTTSLLTDDSSTELNNVYLTQGGVTAQPLYAGFNSNAQISVLVPIFAVSSAYISINTYMMLITPQLYSGDCILNGKHYYCFGLIAMLDE